MSWQTNFPAIHLDPITHRSDVVEGSSTARISMTGDVEISADNSEAARLTGPTGDFLITQYRLTFDGDGSSATGAGTVSYAAHDTFLQSPSRITHVTDDDEVEVTLHVRALNREGGLADSGSYTAQQTLTVIWADP